MVVVLLILGKPLVAVGGGWGWQNPITTNNLEKIWGSSSSDVFAVGMNGTILHYNGSVWSFMPSGTSINTFGIWGSSGNDVFAVGSNGTILHYNGSNWSPMVSGTSSSINGIWGSSRNDVFAVGDGGTILHYNGSVWSLMASKTTQILFGIWGSSWNDVFAVGNNGTVLHSLGFSLFLPLVIYVEPNCDLYTANLEPFTYCVAGIGWTYLKPWKATDSINATKLEVRSNLVENGTYIRIKVNETTIAEWYADVGLNFHREDNISANINPGDMIYFYWGNHPYPYGCFEGTISLKFCKDS
jgi:hypothetical protein